MEFYEDWQCPLYCKKSLVASDVEYRKHCKANVFACKDIPGQKNIVKTPGRPASEPMKQTFENLCDWLDHQAELFTIKELHEKFSKYFQYRDKNFQKAGTLVIKPQK